MQDEILMHIDAHFRINFTPKPSGGGLHYITCLMIYKKLWYVTNMFGFYGKEERMFLCCRWLGVITWMLDIIALIHFLIQVYLLNSYCISENVKYITTSTYPSNQIWVTKTQPKTLKTVQPKCNCLSVSLTYIHTETQIYLATTPWLVMLLWKGLVVSLTKDNPFTTPLFSSSWEDYAT